MNQRYHDLISYCQEGNLKKVEKYLTKFGMDFLNDFSVSHLLLSSIYAEPLYSKEKVKFNKKQFLKNLDVMTSLIDLGLNPYLDLAGKKGELFLRTILTASLNEPTYLLVIDVLRKKEVLQDKNLYSCLEACVTNFYYYNKINKSFLTELNRLNIKINTNNGKIVKGLILSGKEELVLDIFNLGLANAWFYAREIESCSSQKIKFYFDSVKVADSIDSVETIEPLKEKVKNKNKL